jgi:hypothetical protein
VFCSVMFSKLGQFLNQPIGKVLTYCGLFMGGDVCAQKIKQYRDHKKWDLPLCQDDLKFTAGWSLLMGGPMVYKWYDYIDRSTGFKKSLLGSRLAKMGPITGSVRLPAGLIIGKIFVDLIFDIPLYGSYLYTKELYANRATAPLNQVASYTRPLTQTFLTKSANIYKLDLYCWGPANTLGFFFIPDRYRIPYVSTVTALWACALPVICKDDH